MIIDCISDMHGHYPELEGGDLLIVAGDCTGADKIPQWCDFFDWFKKQKYRKKILVAGNHDGLLENMFPKNKQEAEDTKEVEGFIGEMQHDFEYLCDFGTEFEGLKIWGSPWTPWFKGVNPKCKAFMKKDKELKKTWDDIPTDTDILITHGPPFGMLDGIPCDDGSYFYVGSKTLSNRIHQLSTYKLKLHVFGHIHEGYGQCHAAYQEIGTIDITKDNTIPIGHLSVNCSIVDERYQPVNKPIRVEL